MNVNNNAIIIAAAETIQYLLQHVTAIRNAVISDSAFYL